MGGGSRCGQLTMTVNADLIHHSESCRDETIFPFILEDPDAFAPHSFLGAIDNEQEGCIKFSP
jgi:hypothetical protein